MHINMLGLGPTLLVGVLAQINLGIRGWVFNIRWHHVPDVPRDAFLHPHTLNTNTVHLLILSLSP